MGQDQAIICDDGIVTAIVDAAEAPTDGEVLRLDDQIVLPGLVNAHCHLELSHLWPSAEPPEHLATWLLGVRPATPERAAASAAEGARESLSFGVTTVGDITAFPAATRAALAESSLHVVSFGEVRALATRRRQIDLQLPAAIADGGAVSPHAPYSVEPENYRRCLAAAEERGVPLATHLAETRDEVTFLSQHAGPFRELWTTLGGWDDDVPTFAGSAIAYAKHLGLLDATVPVLLAHGNYVDDADLDLLAVGNASMVYCPRTHRYFGHDPHPLENLLARGINVAVGTDSRASSPDLDLLADLSLIAHDRPHLDAATIWKLGTVHAARALGVAAGMIRLGFSADLLVLPDPGGDDPLRRLLASPPSSRRTFSRGQDVGEPRTVGPRLKV